MVGQLAGVANAGRIDLTNNGAAGDSFAIAGNYLGSNGLLLLDTVLGGDMSVSDKLIISGGVASGATSIGIINIGGSGASTTQDGIQVVQAINGATTASGAFALNGPVAAGAFEYFLFKGGVSAGTTENWYLRSTLVAPSAGPTPAPAPAPLEPTPLPAPLPPDPTPAPPPPSAQPAPPVPPEATPGNPDPADPAPPVVVGDPEPEPPPVEAPALSPPPPPPLAATLLPPLPGLTAVPPDRRFFTGLLQSRRCHYRTHRPASRG